MNGFEYTQRIIINLPEPEPEIRKAPPCQTCMFWHKGNCHSYNMTQDFSCYEVKK